MCSLRLRVSAWYSTSVFTLVLLASPANAIRVGDPPLSTPVPSEYLLTILEPLDLSSAQKHAINVLYGEYLENLEFQLYANAGRVRRSTTSAGEETTKVVSALAARDATLMDCIGEILFDRQRREFDLLRPVFALERYKRLKQFERHWSAFAPDWSRFLQYLPNDPDTRIGYLDTISRQCHFEIAMARKLVSHVSVLYPDVPEKALDTLADIADSSDRAVLRLLELGQPNLEYRMIDEYLFACFNGSDVIDEEYLGHVFAMLARPPQNEAAKRIFFEHIGDPDALSALSDEYRLLYRRILANFLHVYGSHLDVVESWDLGSRTISQIGKTSSEAPVKARDALNARFRGSLAAQLGHQVPSRMFTAYTSASGRRSMIGFGPFRALDDARLRFVVMPAHGNDPDHTYYFAHRLLHVESWHNYYRDQREIARMIETEMTAINLEWQQLINVFAEEMGELKIGFYSRRSHDKESGRVAVGPGPPSCADVDAARALYGKSVKHLDTMTANAVQRLHRSLATTVIPPEDIARIESYIYSRASGVADKYAILGNSNVPIRIADLAAMSSIESANPEFNALLADYWRTIPNLLRQLRDSIVARRFARYEEHAASEKLDRNDPQLIELQRRRAQLRDDVIRWEQLIRDAYIPLLRKSKAAFNNAPRAQIREFLLAVLGEFFKGYNPCDGLPEGLCGTEEAKILLHEYYEHDARLLGFGLDILLAVIETDREGKVHHGERHDLRMYLRAIEVFREERAGVSRRALQFLSSA